MYMDKLSVAIETAHRLHRLHQHVSQRIQLPSSSGYELSLAAVKETWHYRIASNDKILLFHRQTNLSAHACCSLGETALLRLR